MLSQDQWEVLHIDRPITAHLPQYSQGLHPVLEGGAIADPIHGHGGGSSSRDYGTDDMLDHLQEKLTEALVKAGPFSMFSV
jgi:hypothetical protein